MPMNNLSIKKRWLLGLFLSFIGLWLLLPNTQQELKSEFPQPGETAQKTILSPITFDIPKNESELKEERERAKQKVLPVFEWDQDKHEKALDNLDHLLQNIKEYKSTTENLLTLEDSLVRDSLKRQATNLFKDLTRTISETALNQLIEYPQSQSLLKKQFLSMMNKGISATLVVRDKRELSLYKQQFNIPDVSHVFTRHNDISLLKDNDDIRTPTKNLITLDQALEKQFPQLQKKIPNSQALQSAFYEVLYALATPNISHMPEELKRRQKKEASTVLHSKGKIIKGMQIIASGEVVTAESVEKLQALHSELAKDEDKPWKNTLGKLMILFLLCIFYWTYFYKQHYNLLRHRNLFFAILLLPLLQLAAYHLQFAMQDSIIGAFPIEWQNLSTFYFLQPFILTPILATVLFDLSIGIALSISSSILLGILYGFDLSPTLEALFPSIVTCFFLKNIRYRSQFLLASLAGLITLSLLVLAHRFLSNTSDWNTSGFNFLLGTFSILASMALGVFFFLPLLEKGLRITTNLTLIELSDFNHPALKLISLETPSTFHHSIMVGNLAEKAAEAIGAHSLLVRVMALYHDIGKTISPEYFTENQKSKDSLHENLEPQESAKIIRSHVDGAFELAKKYSLPPRIIEGIPEHHGTGLIQYFYRKAIAIEGEEKVQEKDFRYLGPKPQTPETAILMLSDSIEAITRSKQEPKPEEIQKIVASVIQTRLMEGELEDSGLKLSDLKKLEIGFLKALEGVFHTRIAYPKGILKETP